MRFSEIPGFENQKEQFTKSIKSGKIAHAQLFKGKEGSPSLSMAMAYATYLNCQNKSSDDSCGECSSCTKMDKLVHPDFHFSFPVASTPKITKASDLVSEKFLKAWRSLILQNNYASIEDWLNFIGTENKQANISKEESRNIIKSLSLRSFEGEYKIMLIWLPEFMHPNASNGLLKILEEPPEKTIFLLVSNEPDKLLGTIISRVQVKSIPLFDPDQLISILHKKYDIELSRAEELSRVSEGNLNLALKLSLDAPNENQQKFQQWMRDCYTKTYSELVSFSEEFHKMTKVNQKAFFNYGLNILREALITQASCSSLKKVLDEDIKFIENLSKLFNINMIENLNSLFNEALYQIERNASAKILALDVSLKTAQLLRPAQ